MTRELKYSEAILEGTDQCMANDPRVYLMGLGVTDPKGTFGTTLNLESKYGSRRVMDMPTSENAMTGIAIGSALVGMRPIMTHQRIDFALLAFDQLFNNAAKWHYMFGGRMSVPLVVRLMIGRGWGQGPQHSQSLQSVFAHFPGLKVVMPATPYDAKGMLISAVEDDNPVIFLEHRWLHGIFGPVPEEPYRVPIGKARVVREGSDLTIVAMSYMTLEALHAAEKLAEENISAEVVDVRTVRPLDDQTILESVRKTGRLIVADLAWKTASMSSEIVSRVVEGAFGSLKCPPKRVTFPETPSPTSHALAAHFYPRAVDVIRSAKHIMGLEFSDTAEFAGALDVPDPSFTGPF